jgi:hypothetical protein
MLNNRNVFAVCPKKGEQVCLVTDYPDPKKSLNDRINKMDLECGHDCDFEPCPIVESHNAIY